MRQQSRHYTTKRNQKPVSTAIVTGSGGLVGAETAKLFLDKGLDVVGIDNDMRGTFFGPEASTRWQVERLLNRPGYTHYPEDIRNAAAISDIFARRGRDIAAIIHCAAQPSHDWAVKDPVADFTINANGTQTLLEATRKHAPDAAFLFVSTNKVYGDRPNHLPLVEHATRFELHPDQEWAARGFPEEMPLDRCLHSLFGVSKLAADVLVQEYGRYFGMRTACFRGGCLTGPGHSGAQLHGFLDGCCDAANVIACILKNFFQGIGDHEIIFHDENLEHDLSWIFQTAIGEPMHGSNIVTASKPIRDPQASQHDNR